MASGFSSSNYLKLNTPLSIAAGEDFEIFTKCVVPSTFENGRGYILSIGYDGSGYGAGIFVNSNGRVVFGCYALASNAHTGDNFVSAGQTLYLKAGRTNGQVYLSCSNDNENWTNFNASGPDMNNAWKDTGNNDTYIGKAAQYAYTCPFNSSIDLNETYIKKSVKLWFFRPATNYLIKDDKLVFADSGLYLAGPNTYTVVGSPTIVDNVASNFNASNVLEIRTNYPSSYNNFEQVVTFTTPSNYSALSLLERLLVPGSRGGMDVNYYNSNLYFHAYFRTTEDTTADKALTIYSPSLQPSTTYTGKFLYDGSKYTLELWQNGSKLGSAELACTYPLYTTTYYSIGGTQGSNDRYFHGSIDLNNTYIKVDGNLWFYGKNYASQNIAPVPSGYTYGNTTTSAIGYVDMRTQQFTAAPSGATIGRDE